MRQESRTIRVAVATALALASASALSAAPTITSIYTTYTTSGTPSNINLNGSGFCGTPSPNTCATKPTITLGGISLVVANATATTASASLPVLSDGEYTLILTAGSAGYVTYNFTVEAQDRGPLGATGATGATGTTGPVGATGAKGSTGAIGAKGATGAQGAQGIQGATGPQGIPGPQGINGSNGLNGLNGAMGATGPQGMPGATGATGATGVGLTYRGNWSPQVAYSVSDLVSINGSSFIAVGPNSNQNPIFDTYNAYWNLFASVGTTGPAGAVGATGPLGPQGPSGIPGSAGPQGAQGPQGIPGAQGLMGATGPVGPTGATYIAAPGDPCTIRSGAVVNTGALENLTFPNNASYLVCNYPVGYTWDLNSDYLVTTAFGSTNPFGQWSLNYTPASGYRKKIGGFCYNCDPANGLGYSGWYPNEGLDLPYANLNVIAANYSQVGNFPALQLGDVIFDNYTDGTALDVSWQSTFRGVINITGQFGDMRNRDTWPRAATPLVIRHDMSQVSSIASQPIESPADFNLTMSVNLGDQVIFTRPNSGYTSVLRLRISRIQ